MRTGKWPFLALGIIVALTVAVGASLVFSDSSAGRALMGKQQIFPSDWNTELYKPDIDVELLTPNPYSRPQTATDKITGIVVHYVANPGSTAMANRSYFEGLKDTQDYYASSNFIIGLEGEIVQCVPTSEIAYASNSRNHDTVSIEVCHPDETGKFNRDTYDSLVWLCGWLCGYLHLTPDDIIRHYDVTGKPCPLYFVEHEDKWEDFKEDVWDWIARHQ